MGSTIAILTAVFVSLTAIAQAVGQPTAEQMRLEEQKPLSQNIASAASIAPRAAPQPLWKTALLIVGFLIASAGVFLALKTLQRRTLQSGQRRYLIESLSYCPVGPGGKAGLSLVKVGKEFVLVGVTSQQITLLSSLPELTSQYERESRFERGSFHSAIEQELAKVEKRPEGTA